MLHNIEKILLLIYTVDIVGTVDTHRPGSAAYYLLLPRSESECRKSKKTNNKDFGQVKTEKVSLTQPNAMEGTQPEKQDGRHEASAEHGLEHPWDPALHKEMKGENWIWREKLLQNLENILEIKLDWWHWENN